MNKRLVVAGVLSASLLTAALPGLASAQTEEALAAENIEWMLGSYLDGEAMTEVPEGVDVSLLMAGGEAGGSAGCNNYFGSYEITEDTLTFGEFASTMALCPEPEQGVEDAYLPLLSEVAGWTVDEAGMLELSNADGAVTLTYSQPAVIITPADIEALIAELESLQAQIDEASLQVTTLVEAAAAVDFDALAKTVSANEKAITDINDTIGRLRNRIIANEEAITVLNNTVDRFRDRIKALETSDKEQNKRITALEEAPTPTSE